LYDYHFDEITVQKICEVAEINRSTFYRYFQDKYDLLYSLPPYMTGEIMGDPNTEQSIDTAESFKAFIYYIEQHKTVFKH
ncbi:TetR/AcrR family transcriptional regulator, partial [Staphylococcus epidermidis]|uniref:TetR/AcrR family transcriptional regulator n=2 Tax=Staphylococcus TaxID=1279 RepID=UPI0030C06E96